MRRVFRSPVDTVAGRSYGGWEAGVLPAPYEALYEALHEAPYEALHEAPYEALYEVL